MKSKGDKMNISDEWDVKYFSPGRVNIIGEHIDYNGGCVLPMAISLGIYGYVRFNDSMKCTVESSIEEGIYSFDINDFEKDDTFTKYIKGIIYVLKKHKYIDKLTFGFDLFLSSTLPSSAGLSSSASLEMLIIHIINDYLDLHLLDIEMVKLAQESEREYVLVNCGIMDQFAIGMAKDSKAIYLDTKNLNYEFVDINLKDAKFIIVNTNKKRTLSDSKYNERREECEKALAELKKNKNKGYLCDFEIDDIDAINDDYLKRRARHVISEVKRVKEFISVSQSEKENKNKLLGDILKQSHFSLRYDYEVTGMHLDLIVDMLNKNNFVYGARMTGAGFGGCIIALVDENVKTKEIMKDIESYYFEKTGINLSYYDVKSSGKTKVMIN